MNSSRRQFIQSAGSVAICFTIPGCGRESGIGFASMDNRIRIDSAGNVSLALGKVELGQGIGTALAQIAAEELLVDFNRVRLVTVDTDHSPDESYTFSSISVQQSGTAVRQAAAAGRQHLLQSAAAELATSIENLDVLDGEIRVAGEPSGLNYWELVAGGQLEIVPSGDEPLLPISGYQTVGRSIQRLDIPGKLFGSRRSCRKLSSPNNLPGISRR